MNNKPSQKENGALSAPMAKDPSELKLREDSSLVKYASESPALLGDTEVAVRAEAALVNPKRGSLANIQDNQLANPSDGSLASHEQGPLAHPANGSLETHKKNPIAVKKE